MLKPRQL